MSQEIRTATSKSPLLTRYEPGFRRTFAQGSLIRTSSDDPEHVRVAFWSSKEDGIQMEETGATTTGYGLEFEAVMSWASLERLRSLIELWQKERAKLEKGTLELVPDAKPKSEAAGASQ